MSTTYQNPKECQHEWEWRNWSTSFTISNVYISGYWVCKICGEIKYQWQDWKTNTETNSTGTIPKNYTTATGKITNNDKCEHEFEWKNWSTSAYLMGYWVCQICGEIKYGWRNVWTDCEQKQHSIKGR